MKKLLFFVCLLSFVCAGAQEKYDKVINEKCYVSYYSSLFQGPAYVAYKLYKGGGDVPRTGMYFKGNLPHFAYAHSDYDKGHMCNAEDFAFSRELEESTFRYWNALPQTPNLNRGIWKSLETKVRKVSQSDSLLIICGGMDFKNLVPAKCWKVVYSLSTGKILYSKVFTNKSSNNTEADIKLNFDFDMMRTIDVVYLR